MAEREACCVCEAAPTLILACSGASNVGQIANNLMIELDQRGVGNGYCLAGVGGDLTAFVESCRAAEVILIDGCPLACGKKTLERHGIEPSKYIVVTDLGVEKTHSFDRLQEETLGVLDKVLEIVRGKEDAA